MVNAYYFLGSHWNPLDRIRVKKKTRPMKNLDVARLDYQPLLGKMCPHSSPRRRSVNYVTDKVNWSRVRPSLVGEDQRPDPGDGGNRA